MPHLSPVLWFLVVSMFLVVLMMFISSFWWMQLSQISINFLSIELKENKWGW